jgi:hypothetical protein
MNRTIYALRLLTYSVEILLNIDTPTCSQTSTKYIQIFSNHTSMLALHLHHGPPEFRISQDDD